MYLQARSGSQMLSSWQIYLMVGLFPLRDLRFGWAEDSTAIPRSNSSNPSSSSSKYPTPPLLAGRSVTYCRGLWPATNLECLSVVVRMSEYSRLMNTLGRLRSLRADGNLRNDKLWDRCCQSVGIDKGIELKTRDWMVSGKVPRWSS